MQAVNTNATHVEQVFAAVQSAEVVKRDPFPSLSLMSNPITPAPPRLRFFPDCDMRMGKGKWRCRVEAADIARHKHLTQMGLSLDHYRATGPEGWGDTYERAYNAWKSKWRACMEKT